MLDIKLVRENTDKVIEALKKRSEGTSVLDKLLSIEGRRRELLKAVEDDRQQRNSLSQEIGRVKKEGGDAAELLEKAKQVSELTAAREAGLRELGILARNELLLI